MSDNNKQEKGVVSQYYESVYQGMKEVTHVLDNISGSVNKQLSTMIEQLNQTKHDINQTIQSNSELLKQAHTTLCEQREAINHRVDEHMTNNIRKVKLNIGGTVFTTTESTLLSRKTQLKEEPTFFSGLLGSGNWQPDSDGEYFIDRSPVVFSQILDYLRTGRLILEHVSKPSRTPLLNELEFYCIPCTHVYKQQLTLAKSTDLPAYMTINYDTVTLTKVKEGRPDDPDGFAFTPLHDVMYSDTISWKVATSFNTPFERWWCYLKGYTYELDETLQIYLTDSSLWDQDNDKEMLFSTKKTPVEQADFMYCRSDQTITITIHGISVTRKLHPNVAVNPRFCLMVEHDATIGSVHVSLT